MARYNYTAKSASGERVSGSVDATDRRGAMLQIERKGFVPISVVETGGGAGPAKDAAVKDAPQKTTAGKALATLKPKATTRRSLSFLRRGSGQPRMKLREVLLFTRELTDLITSGMTLGNALNTLSRRKTKSAQDLIVIQLRDDIIKGDSLSDGLARHPGSFSSLYVNMVRAGEASGRLADALERLAKHYERVEEAREKVIGALTYPAIVVVMGIVTMIFMMVFVVPKFATIFEQLGATLPLPTQILLGMSGFLLHYGWLLAIVVFGGVTGFRRYIRTEKGKRKWHAFVLRAPLARGIISANAFAQFANTLSALLSNGVQVVQALAIVENTMGNVIIAAEIREARTRVTDGSTISAPLAQGKVFPELLTDMLAVGEQTGDLEGSLRHIAIRYDKELDRNVKMFTTAIEPIMIVFIALMVGFIAVSMLMAVLKMTSGLNAE
jgi:type II secretory pathway component PulF